MLSFIQLGQSGKAVEDDPDNFSIDILTRNKESTPFDYQPPVKFYRKIQIPFQVMICIRLGSEKCFSVFFYKQSGIQWIMKTINMRQME